MAFSDSAREAFRQLGFLLQKNFRLQIRRKTGTAIELLLPVFFFLVLVLIRSSIDVTEFPAVTFQDYSVSFDDLDSDEICASPLINGFSFNLNAQQGFSLDIQSALAGLAGDGGGLPPIPGLPGLPGINISDINTTGVLDSFNSLIDCRLGNLSCFSAQRFAEKEDDGSYKNMNETCFNERSELFNYSDVIDAFEEFSAIIDRKSIYYTFAPGFQQGSKAMARDIMDGIADGLRNIADEPLRVEYFDTEEEMVATASLDSQTVNFPVAGIPFVLLNRIAASVVFTSMTADEFRYKIRMLPDYGDFSRTTWHTDRAYPGFMDTKPRSGRGTKYYITSGFTQLQTKMDELYTAKMFPDSDVTAPVFDRMQQFAFKAYTEDTFLLVIPQFMPLLLLLSYIYTAMMTVKELVYEKEQRLREAMRMMGLRDSMSTLAWFLKTLVFLTSSLVLVTILIKYGNIAPNVNGGLLFVFLFLYGISLIAFCFLIAAFFSKTKIVSFLAGIIYFGAYFPNFFMGRPGVFSGLPMNTKLAGCLLAPTCMAFGSQIISAYESQGVGVQNSNIATGAEVGDEFGLVHVYLMLIVDAVLYMALAWYVDKVVPKEYGSRLPVYFILQPSYWFPNWAGKRVDTAWGKVVIGMGDGVDPKDFEAEPEGLDAHISISNLTKEFVIPKGIKTAVNSISMNMYEGHITALLGHNGAGKTTLISMLTGLIQASDGAALIGGQPIDTGMSEIRKSLGVCPQYDVVWELMTVREHLTFYAMLKKVPTADIPEEVDTMIRDIGLWDKREAFSKDLSGGMRRRMSVGMALIGGSKTVILDEPTSGQDPHARRGTWDLLMKHKKGRTMILTTHFMDEADLLGDRIAIMASGDVKTIGSSLFLKNRFGKGYTLTFARARDQKHHSQAIADVVTRHVKGAEPASDVGTELAYRLPSASSGAFKELFDELDDQQDTLGFLSYGLTLTTMEEVFLKVGKQQEDAEKHKEVEMPEKKKLESTQVVSAETPPAYGVGVPKDASSGYDLMTPDTAQMRWQHIKAMALKRLWYSKRDYLAVIIQLALPILFVMAGLITALIRDPVVDDESMVVGPDIYGLEPIPVLAVGADDVTATKGLTDSLEAQFNGFGWDTEEEAWYRTASFQSIVATDGLEAAMQQQAIIDVTRDIRDRRRRPVGYGLRTVNTTTMARAWYSGEGYHDIAVSASALTSAAASYVAKKPVKIYTENHPLPKSTVNDLDVLNNSFLSFGIALCVLFGMAFLVASFAIYLVMERHTGAKHLQFISGVDVYSYWCATFAFDLFNYMIPVLLIIVVFVVFQVEEFSGTTLGGVFILLTLYGWAALPVTYWISFMFKSEMTAYAMVFVFNFFIGLGTLFVVVLLDFPDLNALEENKYLKKLFLIFPTYCLGQGLVALYQNAQFADLCGESAVTQQICDTQGVAPVPIFGIEFPGIGPHIIALTLEGFVYFAVVFAIEADLFARFRKSEALSDRVHGDEDEDVVAERERVMVQMEAGEGKGAGESLVQLRGLAKQFAAKPKPAVDGLWLDIPRNECFGLVGVNGAGKTTTFKMLTGDLSPTDGDAIMSGYSILSDMKKIRQKVGYCPQFDAIIGKLTGKEMLTMYAMMRGVPMDKISSLVSQSIRELDLVKYQDMLCGTYSGGNKRKLSTAIALIGDPDVLLLDEPSTGMDPGARRFIWNTINTALTARGGRSIVLTTHSMEECEALCSRLVVMVNGQFKCLGSLQHLKTRFGNGFNLMAKVDKAEKSEALCEYIVKTFPGAVVKESHFTMSEFVLPGTSKWGDMFDIIESARSDLGIIDYGISQPTLEQIFIGFAKGQNEEV